MFKIGFPIHFRFTVIKKITSFFFFFHLGVLSYFLYSNHLIRHLLVWVSNTESNLKPTDWGKWCGSAMGLLCDLT